MLKEFINGLLAGLMISIGGSVSLSVGSVAGAVLFSVALFTICIMGFSLFTGKIGFCAIDRSKDNIIKTLISLLSNFLGCIIFGLLIRVGIPSLANAANVICTAKLTQEIYEALIRAMFCGVLMYVAVWAYREKKTIVGIFICIPVFILSGFEHSIADIFYFATAGFFNLKTLGYIAIIVVGNAVGGMFIPLMQNLINCCQTSNKNKKDNVEAQNEQD